jgi:excisionase family DNA binding protein
MCYKELIAGDNNQTLLDSFVLIRISIGSEHTPSKDNFTSVLLAFQTRQKEIPMTERLLTGNDLAQLLRISRAAAYNLMRRGEIPTIHLGRCVHIRPADLEQYIASKVVIGDNRHSG